jgi:hypothetical protein
MIKSMLKRLFSGHIHIPVKALLDDGTTEIYCQDCGAELTQKDWDKYWGKHYNDYWPN